MKKITLIAALWLVSVSAGAADLIGQGNMTLSADVAERFRLYGQSIDPLAFAVSVDGVKGAGAICPVPGTCAGADSKAFAVKLCEEVSPHPAPCRIFAIGRDVVWQGQTRTGDGQPFQTQDEVPEPEFSDDELDAPEALAGTTDV